jgi:DNA-directed RNA polymerase sigma subunit (sigma70/sigma32)
MSITKRNLSGVWVTYTDSSGQFEKLCFEDLPRSTQHDYLNGLSESEAKRLCLKLAETLQEIGKDFNIEKL